jgi:hypothetical protein
MPGGAPQVAFLKAEPRAARLGELPVPAPETMRRQWPVLWNTLRLLSQAKTRIFLNRLDAMRSTRARVAQM